MKNNLKLYFSLVSGDMFYVNEDEVKNLDESHIPLKQKPSSSCKSCYGRFYIGRDVKYNGSVWQKGHYIPCPKCMRKCVDWEQLKSKDVTVETPRTTTEIANDAFSEAIENTQK